VHPHALGAPFARNAFLRDTVTSRDTVTLFRFRPVTRFHQARVVDVQIRDRLVDPDQPDLLAELPPRAPDWAKSP
jgi:hypothetical protein